MKRLAIAVCAISLAACASASDPGAMLAEVSETTIISDESPLRSAVSMGDVTGGKETNPLWTSEVSSEDFAEALRQSFAAHAMLATDAGDYRLDANLEKLKQPLAGFNITVTSIVNYTLTELATDEVVFEETIEEAYTAKVGDAFMGVKRLQLANEGSIKGNITTLIEMLIQQFDPMAAEPMPPSGDDSESDVTS